MDPPRRPPKPSDYASPSQPGTPTARVSSYGGAGHRPEHGASPRSSPQSAGSNLSQAQARSPSAGSSASASASAAASPHVFLDLSCLADKPVTDLRFLASEPALLDALYGVHHALPGKHALVLSEARSEVLALHAQLREALLPRRAALVQELLPRIADLTRLEQKWEDAERAMYTALRKFGNEALYTRLKAAVDDAEKLSELLAGAFLDAPSVAAVPPVAASVNHPRAHSGGGGGGGGGGDDAATSAAVKHDTSSAAALAITTDLTGSRSTEHDQARTQVLISPTTVAIVSTESADAEPVVATSAIESLTSSALFDTPQATEAPAATTAAATATAADTLAAVDEQVEDAYRQADAIGQQTGAAEDEDEEVDPEDYYGLADDDEEVENSEDSAPGQPTAASGDDELSAMAVDEPAINAQDQSADDVAPDHRATSAADAGSAAIGPQSDAAVDIGQTIAADDSTNAAVAGGAPVEASEQDEGGVSATARPAASSNPTDTTESYGAAGLEAAEVWQDVAAPARTAIVPPPDADPTSAHTYVHAQPQAQPRVQSSTPPAPTPQPAPQPSAPRTSAPQASASQASAPLGPAATASATASGAVDVTEFIKSYRQARKLYHARRHRLARLREGRVFGVPATGPGPGP